MRDGNGNHEMQAASPPIFHRALPSPSWFRSLKSDRFFGATKGISPQEGQGAPANDTWPTPPQLRQ